MVEFFPIISFGRVMNTKVTFSGNDKTGDVTIAEF